MRALLSTGRVPPIPPAYAGPIASHREAVLLWCFAGRATVAVDGMTHRLTAGQFSWVPPGHEMTVHASADSVLFPIALPGAELPSPLVEPRLLSAPDGLQGWLIHHFARTLHYLRGATSQSAGLIELIAHGADAGPNEEVVVPPRVPRSPEAAEVAATLLRNPVEPSGLAAFAARGRISTSTLQRQFRHQTGLSFARWRTRARLAAAAAYIADGERIGRAANRAGFDTASGFVRAFVTHTGSTPTGYFRHRSPSPATTPLPAEQFIDGLAAIADANNPESARESAPTGASYAGPIPAAETWPRINTFHVVVWVYRGTANVQVADRTWRLAQGDAMLLPAGHRIHVAVPAGSLLLPLGYRAAGSPLHPDQLTVVHLADEAEHYLLHTVVANYTSLRPHSYHPHQVVTDFHLLATSPPGHGPSRTASEPVRRIMQSLIADPADSRDLAGWASHLHTEPARLRTAFLAETGMTFPRWRAQRRMTLARQLLHAGDHAATVARRVGYAHASGFTRAFIAAHGMTPSAYQSDQLH